MVTAFLASDGQLCFDCDHPVVGQWDKGIVETGSSRSVYMPETNEFVLRPAQQRALPQLVADQLIKVIAASGMPALRLPSERELSEQFEVGRNALREALTFLEGIGVITTRKRERFGNPGRARAQLVAFSTRPPVDGLLADDPIETRRIIEPSTAALAAERRTAEDIAEIGHWIDVMQRAHDGGQRVIDYDEVFHVSIARATRNHTLLELVNTLMDVTHESREMSFEPVSAAEAALDDHRRIFEAIRDGDPEAARTAMLEHVTQVERLIKEASRKIAEGEDV
ncbi:FCD domain-containing protein [Microbacterium sp. MEC084]|uniref:FadR/GntR family transcriptional regulator n=1 Tax=Microbacterium sp. MEC084 TaxID=1963027 RepID=UPI00106F6506|nr:FadR/GntR family transcriptional regulator [Microbacterium sp. MEC084]MCD1270036.1 FCD domain-containing protein [Microbacterium sp. MEC084]